MANERIDPIIAEPNDIISHTPADLTIETLSAKNLKKTVPTGISAIWRTFILIALLSSIAIALFSWQQYQYFIALQQGFETLDSRLSSTDQSVTQSSAAMQVSVNKQGDELKKHWSEIKKLWGVASDTNRGKIADNSNDIAFLVSKRVELEVTITKLQAKVEKGEETLSAISGNYLELSADIDALKQSLSNYTSALKKVQVSQVRQQRQLKTNDEAIKSVDEFRRQINQKILKLEQISASETLPLPE